MKLQLDSDWYAREYRIEATSPATSIAAGAACLDWTNPVVSNPPELRTGELPTFGRLINIARRNRGLTRTQLSNEVDLRVQSLVKIENDDMCPDEQTLRGLSKVLNLSVFKLISVYGFASETDFFVREERPHYGDLSDRCEEPGVEELAALQEFFERRRE